MEQPWRKVGDLLSWLTEGSGVYLAGGIVGDMGKRSASGTAGTTQRLARLRRLTMMRSWPLGHPTHSQRTETALRACTVDCVSARDPV